MSLATIGFFGCAVLVVVTTLRSGVDAFSPGRVFLFVWCMALGLTDLKYSALQTEWTVESWIKVVLGPLSLLTGVFIVNVLHLNSPVLTLPQVRARWRDTKVDTKRLYIAVCSVFAFYAIGYLAIFLYKGFIPLFLEHGGSFRSEFQMFGLGMSIQSMPIVVFFTTAYVLLEKGHKLRRLAAIGMSTIAVVTFLFLLQRFQVILVGVMCLTLLYYTTRHVRLSTVLVALSFATLFFYWVSGLRGGQLFMHFLYVESKMRFPAAYAFFTEPYMYLVMNIENLARSVEMVDRHTYGLYTFDFLGALTGLKHWTREYFGLNDTPYLVSAYNTYTAFWTYYRDFGVFGITVIPLALGVGAGTVYHGMRKNPTLPRITAYAIVLFVLLISFFNSPTSFLWFMWIMVVMYVILRVTVVTDQGPGTAEDLSYVD